MKIDRLLAIVMMLVNRKKITARELSETFEVSSRTIYRDMEVLGSAGFPVISYHGSEGGFGFVESYKIEKQFFTHKEFSMLLTSLKGLSTAIEDSTLSGTIEKIKTIISSKDKEGKELQEKSFPPLVINLSPWGQPGVESEKMMLIRQGIAEQRILQFSYTSAKMETLVRNIEPLTLLIQGTNCYLCGYCLVRNDYRLFKVSRITSPVLKGDISRRVYTGNKYPWEKMWDDGPVVSILLQFNEKASLRIKDDFFEDEIVKKSDGLFLVRINSSLKDWIYGLILSYGSDVEVLEPDFVREELKKRILEMYNKYF